MSGQAEGLIDEDNIASPRSIADGALTAALERVTHRSEIERLWRELEGRSDGSFFQSWLWIGCWLEAQAEAPWLLSVRDDGGRVVALGLFCASARRWPRAGELLLHQTGDPSRDRIYVEYNGMLVARRAPHGIEEACLRALLAARRPAWHRLRLSGVDGRWAAAADRLGLHLEIERKTSARIELRALRASGTAVLESYGYNTRQQVRRSLRHYERLGPVTARPAGDVATALHFLSELKTLHQLRFGARGAFAAPAFESFHRRLIECALPLGAVELLRIEAGASVIGYVYSFVWRGWVGYYTSGFDYSAPKQVKPGLVCLTLAAERWRARGADAFDLMAGAQRYKSNIGLAGPELLWLELRRPGLRSATENVLRGAAAVIKGVVRGGVPLADRRRRL